MCFVFSGIGCKYEHTLGLIGCIMPESPSFAHSAAYKGQIEWCMYM